MVAALEPIFTHLSPDAKGAKEDDFNCLRIAIGVAREMAKDIDRKKARLEREEKIERLKEEPKEKLEAALKSTHDTEEVIEKPETAAAPLLGKSGKMETTEMLSEAETIEKSPEEARAEIAKTRGAVSKLTEDLDEDSHG
jgi:hypothetical protein